MKSFQTYTPRVKRMVYDSLKTDVGCQEIEGTNVFASQAFERICIFAHDDSSGIFNQSDKIAYAYGPVAAGSLPPWPTRWAAWVASAGIRVGQYPLVTLPSDTLGAASALFPTLTPAPLRVTLGFTSLGFMGIAIQRTDGQIQVKWITSSLGAQSAQIFTGLSPLLFSNSLLFSGTSNQNDLVLYYLRSSRADTIFARFQHESFATEHVINTDLPVSLSKLLSSEAIDGRQVLYALDTLGRDVTLRSPVYNISAGGGTPGAPGTNAGDKAKLSLAMNFGDYRQSSIPVGMPTLHKAKLSVSIHSGAYADVIVEPGAEPDLSSDKATLSIAIESGSYE